MNYLESSLKIQKGMTYLDGNLIVYSREVDWFWARSNPMEDIYSGTVPIPVDGKNSIQLKFTAGEQQHTLDLMLAAAQERSKELKMAF